MDKDTSLGQKIERHRLIEFLGMSLEKIAEYQKQLLEITRIADATIKYYYSIWKEQSINCKNEKQLAVLKGKCEAQILAAEEKERVETNRIKKKVKEERELLEKRKKRMNRLEEAAILYSVMQPRLAPQPSVLEEATDPQ